MNEPMSPTVFYGNQVRLAEAHFKRGNLKGAIRIMKSLTFGEPNTSTNHCKTSQILIAYEIHLCRQKDGFTHYDALLSSPLSSHEMIQWKYRKILDVLCPDRNISVAAKSAFEIINNAWRILSDPKRRRDYNIQEGFESKVMFQEDEPNQTAREGKRPSIEIINVPDSDSDSD